MAARDDMPAAPLSCVALGLALLEECFMSGNPREHYPQEKSPVALLLIDVINDLAFADGNKLLRQALPMAKRLAALKRQAKRVGIPRIYVNDNFGRWQSDFQKVLRHCLAKESRGKPLATLLRPDAEDYFVLKPNTTT